jgi:hypothetical protein
LRLHLEVEQTVGTAWDEPFPTLRNALEFDGETGHVTEVFDDVVKRVVERLHSVGAAEAPAVPTVAKAKPASAATAIVIARYRFMLPMCGWFRERVSV